MTNRSQIPRFRLRLVVALEADFYDDDLPSLPAASVYDTTAEPVPPSRPLAKCNCGAERRRLAGGSK